MSIAPVARLASNSRVVIYDTKLQSRGNVFDLYTFKSGLYNRKNESWPKDAIKMRVKDATASENVITMIENLRLPGVYGNTLARGTEEDVRTKDLKVYQNNYRKVIPKPGYGLRELEANKYKLYDKHTDSIGTWNQEELGYNIRHALLERFSPNLLAGDTAATLNPLQSWNPNFFIPTLSIYNQPTYSTNRANHTTNIVQGLMNAGGLTQFAQRTLTAPVLEDLSNWALNPMRLIPLKIPQLPTGEGFVLTVSELQAAYLSNPTFVNNNLGSLWIAKERFSKELQCWPGVIGRYNNILIVVDPRQPTLLPSGSASPYSMTAGYMVWDSRDLRLRSNANIKDTAFLLGRGACVEVEGQPLHWIADEQDYAFHKGLGTAGVRGQQLPIYSDQDSGETVQQTSAVVVLDLPNNGTLATL